MRDGNKRFSEVICSSEYADKSIAIKELVRILLKIFLCSFKLWMNIQMLILWCYCFVPTLLFGCR